MIDHKTVFDGDPAKPAGGSADTDITLVVNFQYYENYAFANEEPGEYWKAKGGDCLRFEVPADISPSAAQEIADAVGLFREYSNPASRSWYIGWWLE